VSVAVVVVLCCQSKSSVLDADTQYYWLSTLRLLCIHANCLQQSAPDEISFVQYCLKYLMVPRSASTYRFLLTVLYALRTFKHLIKPGFRVQMHIEKKHGCTVIEDYHLFKPFCSVN